MNILQQMKHQTVLVLGLGVTGLSCARFLQANGVDFAVNDSRSNINIQPLYDISPTAHCVTGCWDTKLIAQAEVIIASPGVDLTIPAIANAINSHCDVIGDVELFCQLTTVPVLAVTGSNGKSTVVSLLAHMAKSLGVNAVLAGNIGVPVLDLVNQPADCIILELSSFQLETVMSMSAVAATVLNVSDDHLDRHQTFAIYSALKHKIYTMAETAVVSRQVEANTSIPSNQQLVSFGLDTCSAPNFGLVYQEHQQYLAWGAQPLVAVSELPIAGKHNVLNCLAALALGSTMDWSVQGMANSLLTFTGLAHRCQRIITTDGRIWINDSKATNVGATIAAIEGLKDTANIILIAGGDGKGADFTPLAEVIETSVTQLITLGKDGGELAKLKPDSVQVQTMSEAVNAANSIAVEGDIVLLSPACASIDMYKNYMQRGDEFARLAQQTEALCN